MEKNTFTRIHQALFTPIDSAFLGLFRIVFGFLLFFQSAKFINRGWAEKGWGEAKYSFTFIGFEWLSELLPGSWMVLIFYALAAFGIMIMFGLFYRFAMVSYTLLWTVIYLTGKAYYNNHYYLLILICLFMVFSPANRAFAVDNILWKRTKSTSIPGWSRWIYILQLLVVYTFAGYAKMDGDWLAGAPMAEWFADAPNQKLLGHFMQSEWYRMGVAVGGLLFDTLIVPILLWRRTRNLGLVLSIIFHLHNSYTFNIGIFPYLMICMNVFFYPPYQVGNWISRWTKRPCFRSSTEVPSNWTLSQKCIVGLGLIYFIVQVWLPLRYLAYPGNVHWTEEGHRMAWQMMLKAKRGEVTFLVRLPPSDTTEIVDLSSYLNRSQILRMETRPDMIWQFAQHLEKDYHNRGFDRVEVYVRSFVSLNGRKPQQFIDHKVNLAAQEWHQFEHSPWIMPFVE